MQSDLTTCTYATLEETLRYVYRSAESVGLMMARIISLPDQALPYARLLGRVFQYVNFIRDLMEDLRLGRVYLPQSDILACGLPCLSHQTIAENPESFCGLIRMQLSRYRQWRAESDYGFRLIPSRYRAAILTAADMYDYTAGIIERDPMIVLRCKVKPTAARILVHGLANQIGVRL